MAATILCDLKLQESFLEFHDAFANAPINIKLPLVLHFLKVSAL